jgi:hypothetical protein
MQSPDVGTPLMASAAFVDTVMKVKGLKALTGENQGQKDDQT